MQYLSISPGSPAAASRAAASTTGLWLFSLNGTIESLPPGSGDPPPDDGDGNTETNDERAFLTQLDLSRTPNLVRGKEIYTTVCTACHGPMGVGGHLGVPFKEELAVVDIVVTARSGVNGTSGDVPCCVSYRAQGAASR